METGLGLIFGVNNCKIVTILVGRTEGVKFDFLPVARKGEKLITVPICVTLASRTGEGKFDMSWSRGAL